MCLYVIFNGHVRAEAWTNTIKKNIGKMKGKQQSWQTRFIKKE